jgi:hypothetical protein
MNDAVPRGGSRAIPAWPSRPCCLARLRVPELTGHAFGAAPFAFINRCATAPPVLQRPIFYSVPILLLIPLEDSQYSTDSPLGTLPCIYEGQLIALYPARAREGQRTGLWAEGLLGAEGWAWGEADGVARNPVP